MLSIITKYASTTQSEWERDEGELYNGVWTFQSAKRDSPNPGMEYLYSPFPLLAVMSKTCTSRTVRDALTDCLRLNSNNKTQSQLLLELPVGPGGLFDRTPWTVRQGLTDRPRVGRRLSARSTRPAHRSVCFEDNFGLPAEDPRTVRL
jgi:hypothetical protein